MGRFRMASYDDANRWGFTYGGPQHHPDEARVDVLRMGAASRAPDGPRYRALEVKTEHSRIVIEVSPGGRSIRVWKHGPLGSAEMMEGVWSGEPEA